MTADYLFLAEKNLVFVLSFLSYIEASLNIGVFI